MSNFQFNSEYCYKKHVSALTRIDMAHNIIYPDILVRKLPRVVDVQIKLMSAISNIKNIRSNVDQVQVLNCDNREKPWSCVAFLRFVDQRYHAEAVELLSSFFAQNPFEGSWLQFMVDRRNVEAIIVTDKVKFGVYLDVRKELYNKRANVEQEARYDEVTNTNNRMIKKLCDFEYFKDDIKAYTNLLDIPDELEADKDMPNPDNCPTEKMRVFINYLRNVVKKRVVGYPAGFNHSIARKNEYKLYETNRNMIAEDKSRLARLLMKCYNTILPSQCEILIESWYKPFETEPSIQSEKFLRFKLRSLDLGEIESINFCDSFSHYCCVRVKFRDILVHPYAVLKINNEQWIEGIEAYDIFPFKDNLKIRDMYLGAYIDNSRNYFDKGQTLSEAINAVRAEFLLNERELNLAKDIVEIRKARFNKFKRNNPTYFNETSLTRNVYCFVCSEDFKECDFLEHMDWEHPAIGAILRLVCFCCYVPVHSCKLSDFVQLECGHFCCVNCHKIMTKRAFEIGIELRCFICRSDKIQGHRMLPFNSNPREFSKEPVAKYD